MAKKAMKEVKNWKDFTFRQWTDKDEEGKKKAVKKQADKFKIKMDDNAITEAVAYFDTQMTDEKKGTGATLNLKKMTYDELKDLMKKIKPLLVSKKTEAIEARNEAIKALQTEIKDIEEDK